MYEQINQRAAQQAVEGKVAAMSQHEMNDRLLGQMAAASRVVRDKPLMDVEYDRLSQSVAELDVSVAELLARIAPVCQPGGLGCGETKDANGQKIESTPSDLRSRLMGLRGTVESISRQIAEVKFRIEI